jgi:hypothetical protein
MFDTHKLVIIPSDGCVSSDHFTLIELDFSQSNIPDDVHALQWNNPIYPDKNKSHLNGLSYGQGQGWIELRSSDPNVNITELPQWAIDVYLLAKNEHNNQNNEI